MSELLFVYGTLQKDHINNWMLKNSVFVSDAWTKKQYAMYQDGIPYVTNKKRVSQIYGELWLVSEAILKQVVDPLEGHPSWYKREQVSIMSPNEELTSNCCGAKVYEETDICGACNDHCDVEDFEEYAWIYFNDCTKGKLMERGRFIPTYKI